jgi:hypothetical protein
MRREDVLQVARYAEQGTPVDVAYAIVVKEPIVGISYPELLQAMRRRYDKIVREKSA